ncbi:MAG: hypothetical protein HOH33_08745 [Verrucomicrobia bacterium]|nr:hypothetical protein [Verrucomicrobiota bacterium]
MGAKMNIVKSMWMAFLCTFFFSERSLWAQPEEIDSLRASYQTILDRNPFNLQPPPPPKEEVVEEPEDEESPELDELNLKIAGVSAKDELRRVWMAMTIPNSDPELPPVERFFSFTESEDEHHGVKVKQIDLSGNIEIEFYGKNHELDFEEYRYDGASGGGKGKGKGSNVKAPTRISARELIRRRALEQTKSTGNRPSTTSGRSTSRITSPSSGSLLQNAGRSSSPNGLQRIPTRSTRTSTNARQAQPAFNREEQILMLEAQSVLADREGRAMPPVPPLRR